MSTQIPEDALHKILAQIQQQVLSSTRELNMVRAQCNTVESQRKRTKLTLEQMELEKQDASLWNGVGKMFMLQDKDRIVTQLRSKEKALSDEVSNLSKKQKFLEKQASDAQGHMRDIFRGVEAQQAAASQNT